MYNKVITMKILSTTSFHVDGCFANNIEYLFCAQYATEIKQIKDSTQDCSLFEAWENIGREDNYSRHVKKHTYCQ